jgi:putative SOS response-associated peptidase YedK
VRYIGGDLCRGIHEEEVAEDEVEFARVGEDWFSFVGSWRPMPQDVEAFTLLTTDPSPDVAPTHDRQMVILERAD